MKKSDIREFLFKYNWPAIFCLAVILLTSNFPAMSRTAAADTTVAEDTIPSKSASVPAAAVSKDPDDILILSGTVSENNTYSSPEIESTQVIASGSVVYTAGDEITLGPGFEVQAGATFETNIPDNFYKDVTMLTYNLKGKQTDGKIHGTNIKKFQADVVSLQELYGPGEFNKIKDASGLEGKIYYTIAASYGIGMLWNPSVVGDPIRQDEERIDTPVEDPDNKRAYMVAEFRYFCFVATHFSTNKGYHPKMARAILNNAIVKDCIAKDKPVYIAGDLNVSPTDSEDERRGLDILKDNGFEVLNKIDTSHATGFGGGYIDLILEHNAKPKHLLIDRGIPLTVTEKNKWKYVDKISDHFPYRVKVKIR